MKLEVEYQKEYAVIKLSGKFTYAARKLFTDAYKELLYASPYTTIHIDFSMIDYLDSAALGMLLLLKERSEESGKQVIITNCSGFPLDLMNIAGFTRIFQMAN